MNVILKWNILSSVSPSLASLGGGGLGGIGLVMVCCGPGVYIVHFVQSVIIIRCFSVSTILYLFKNFSVLLSLYVYYLSINYYYLAASYLFSSFSYQLSL